MQNKWQIAIIFFKITSSSFYRKRVHLSTEQVDPFGWRLLSCKGKLIKSCWANLYVWWVEEPKLETSTWGTPFLNFTLVLILDISGPTRDYPANQVVIPCMKLQNCSKVNEHTKSLQSQAKIVGTLGPNVVFSFSWSSCPSQSCLSRFSHQNLYTNIEGTRRHKSVPTIINETVF